MSQPVPPNDFHVAIVVRAGIAGLALALALHNKSIPFTLYESAAEFSVVGAGIGFGPNGLRAMDGIEKRFRARYDEVCVGNRGKGKEGVFFEGMLLEQGLGSHEEWYGGGNGRSGWGGKGYTRKSAHRKDLLDIMTSYIPAERVVFSKVLTDIVQDLEGVTLTFADGEQVKASILAGVEGIQSVTRKHVLERSPQEIAPVYAGSYCYRAVIPIEEAQEILGELTDVAKFYFGQDRGCVTYRISGGREFNFLLCVADGKPWPSSDTVTERLSHEEMMADFADPNIDDRFRRLLSKANPVKWGLFHHKHTSTYYRGRVVLLGDSAHASLPFQAAGAGQGVEDAYVLANLLEKLLSSAAGEPASNMLIEAALKGYDAVRRPRAQKQLEQSAEVADMLFFQHLETGSDMTKVLAKMQHGRFDWLWGHDLEDDVQAAYRIMDEAVVPPGKEDAT
ncbi:Salicylate hydroxylase [Cyphellophora attinorum]|uniref:Salicylate hydroxylase n=1 Tax=Cyphellophora attinorum TaxID=1664694 RepID=A0A0N0NMS3_9EURO|nr:Salicylate hydroxylase [Phialophora attinorum]KPI40791.1 Salicylate hydroxylase [Phialophora attinorum]